jgi:hypothetical protein
VNLLNQVVHFRLCDVYLPDPASLLQELYGKQILQGEVLDVSDSGTQAGSFAVVRVEGVAEPVIVPAQHVQVSFR